MVLRAQASGACVAPGATFGVSDYSATPTQTALEDGPLATVDTHTFVHHRISSPFGAGWAVDDVSRAYHDGDVAHLAAGSGAVELFTPRAHANAVIQRVDATTGATTNVLSGLGYSIAVHGLASPTSAAAASSSWRSRTASSRSTRAAGSAC